MADDVFYIENDPIAFKTGILGLKIGNRKKSPETVEEIFKGLCEGTDNYISELTFNKTNEYTFSFKIQKEFNSLYSGVILAINDKVKARSIAGNVVIIIADEIELDRLEADMHILLIANSIKINKLVCEHGFIYSPKAEYKLEGNATQYINEDFVKFPDIKKDIFDYLSFLGKKYIVYFAEEREFIEKLLYHLTF